MLVMQSASILLSLIFITPLVQFAHGDGGQNVTTIESLDVNSVQWNPTPLAQAMLTGDVEGMKQMLSSNNSTSPANVNEAIGDANATTPLQLAVRIGNGKMTILLLEAKADVNAQDANNWTALHHLAASPLETQDRLLLLLLSAGANPNILNSAEQFPLELMLSQYHSMALAYLNTQIPLHNRSAAYKEFNDLALAIIKLLSRAMYENLIEDILGLERFRMIEKVLGDLLEDGTGNVALAEAITFNKPSVVKLLLNSHVVNMSRPLPAIVTAGRLLPLHLAAYLGRATIIALMVADNEGNADVNVQDERGWTALHHLAVGGLPGSVASALSVLLAAGANPLIRNADGQLPLDLAMADPNADPQIIEMLKQKSEQ